MTKINKSGHALVMLLVFVTVGMIVVGSSTALVIVNSAGSLRYSQHLQAHAVAEGGMENALMRMLRNPNYMGETLTVGDGTATITVSNNGLVQVESIGTVGSIQSKVVVEIDDTNGMLDVVSWKEEW